MTNNQFLGNFTTSLLTAPNYELALGVGLTEFYAYPANEFPEVMRDMINAVEEKTNAPIAMIGTFMLSTSSEATQGGYNVQAPDEMLAPPIVWGVSYADSGTGKTPVTNMLRKPITDFETIARNKYYEKMKQHEKNHQIWKVKYAALKREFNKAIKKQHGEKEMATELAAHIEAEPTKPRLIKLTYQDTTPEALCFSLFENWPNAALVYDEGSVFLNSRMTDYFGMLNKLWEMAPLAISRRNHKKELFIQDPRLSITLGIQLGASKRDKQRCEAKAHDLGFHSRTLVCMPIKSRWKDTTYPTSSPSNAVDCYYRRITELLAAGVSSTDEPVKEKKIVTFNTEASSLFIEYRKMIELQLSIPGSKLNQIPDFGSKLSRHTTRLAANFELIQTGNTTVSHETLQRAIKVMDWYVNEYHRIFAPPPEMPEYIKNSLIMLEKLNDLSKHHETRYLPKWLAQNYAPGSLRAPGKANQALMDLHQAMKIKLAIFDGVEYIDMNPGWMVDPIILRTVIDEYRRKRSKYNFRNIPLP